jgi:hypothetical protein
MSVREAVALEFRVAFSRNVQPVWVRVLKWIVIVSAVVYFRRAPYFWWPVLGVVCLAVGLHLLWRIKTRRWTQPWRDWNDLEVTRRRSAHQLRSTREQEGRK